MGEFFALQRRPLYGFDQLSVRRWDFARITQFQNRLACLAANFSAKDFYQQLPNRLEIGGIELSFTYNLSHRFLLEPIYLKLSGISRLEQEQCPPNPADVLPLHRHPSQEVPFSRQLYFPADAPDRGCPQ